MRSTMSCALLDAMLASHSCNLLEIDSEPTFSCYRWECGCVAVRKAHSDQCEVQLCGTHMIVSTS